MAFYAATYVATTNNALNYWTITLNIWQAGVANSQGSVTTAAITAGQWKVPPLQRLPHRRGSNVEYHYCRCEYRKNRRTWRAAICPKRVCDLGGFNQCHNYHQSPARCGASPNVKDRWRGRAVLVVLRGQIAARLQAVAGAWVAVPLEADPTARRADVDTDGRCYLTAWDDRAAALLAYPRAGLGAPCAGAAGYRRATRRRRGCARC